MHQDGKGTSHIWRAKTIDEGIEVLTGWKAGARNAAGTFPEGTVNFLADTSLRKLAEIMKDLGKEAGEQGRGDQKEAGKPAD